MYRPLLLMRVKFGVLKQTERLHLHAKFHLNVFIVSASGGQKRQFWANFYFWGAPVLTPITDEGQLIRCATADPQHTFKCQNLSRSVYSISPSGDEAPNFCRFLGWHFVISTVGGNPRKLNMGAQLQLTFPYPTASKSFLYSNIFMVKSGAQTLTFKSVMSQKAWRTKKRDRQKAWLTDKTRTHQEMR